MRPRSSRTGTNAFRERELAELPEVFVSYRADRDSAASVAAAINRDPETAQHLHLREELGVDPSTLPSPVTAAIASLLSCALGGLIPLLPFLLGSTSLALARCSCAARPSAA